MKHLFTYFSIIGLCLETDSSPKSDNLTTFAFFTFSQRTRGSSKTFSYLSSVNPSADEKKRKNLGFLHYKTQILPAPAPGRKRILNVLIIEADGLEQGYFSRWPYVKLIHGNQVYKTPPAAKSIAVCNEFRLTERCLCLLLSKMFQISNFLSNVEEPGLEFEFQAVCKQHFFFFFQFSLVKS